MKTNDIYYHPTDHFIWIKPDKMGWGYGYIRLSDGNTSGFDHDSMFERQLIFITHTTTPDIAELWAEYPELLI